MEASKFIISPFSITAIEEFTLCTNFCESIFFRVNILDYGSVNVGGIYRPPNGSTADFFNFLSSVGDFFRGKKLIMLGDFNLDLNSADSVPQVRDFIDIMNSHGYISTINIPTYVSPTTNV